MNPLSELTDAEAAEVTDKIEEAARLSGATAEEIEDAVTQTIEAMRIEARALKEAAEALAALDEPFFPSNRAGRRARARWIRKVVR